MDTSLFFSGYLGKRIHIGVTGSIAAYKALDLVRGFSSLSVQVSATLTNSAQQFVSRLSFEALGADPVYTDMFHPEQGSFGHLEPGREADALLIAPATANTIGKLANGIADDMLSTQALAFTKELIVAPAMNPALWEAPATKENWDRLLKRGIHAVSPISGPVACGDTGKGRMAPLEEILAVGLRALSPQDLSGKKIVLTLGPTREFFDAVRFWSNPSSGRMGASLAVAAWLRGADVTVVAGPMGLNLPSGIKVIDVTTAAEMFEATTDLWPNMDIGCLTAAVADYKPDPHGPGKMKKQDAGEQFSISFSANPDILKYLGEHKQSGQTLIGFAAESEEPGPAAKKKLAAKKLDIIVGNRIDRPGSGFGSGTNQVHLLDRNGRDETWPELPKTEVAWRVWDHLQLL